MTWLGSPISVGPRQGNNNGATAQLTSGKAYFRYLDFIRVATLVKYVECLMTAVGTGAAAGEIGLFSSPAAPNKAGQNLTPIPDGLGGTLVVNQANMTSLTAAGLVIVRNTVAFAKAIPPGTFLWAGIRTAMGANQPTFAGLNGDLSQGWALETAASGLLTGAGPFAGVVPTTLVGGGAFSGGGSVMLDLRYALV